MIAEIIDKIRQDRPLGLRDVPFCGNFQRHAKLFLYPSDAPPYVLKITCGPEAAYEYHALSAMRARLQRHVPEPIYYVETAGGSAVACKLIPHRRLSADRLQEDRFSTQMIEILDSMASGDSNCVWREPVSLENIVKTIERHVREWDISNSVMSYAKRLAETFFDHWPATPQHGDLTIYNLGHSGPDIIIFDWEDYGFANLGGLDLATLMFSSMPAGRFRPARHQAALLRLVRTPLAQCYLKTLGVAPETMLRYFPFFLLCFLALKTSLGYGREVRNRTAGFIRSAFDTDLWKTGLN